MKGMRIMKEETIKEILRFRDERDWKKFHNPKDLSISICLEAAELLEVFQWSAQDTQCDSKIEKIKEELADILIYCVHMADICKLNIDEIITEKLSKNAKKYSVEKAKGNKNKYTDI